MLKPVLTNPWVRAIGALLALILVAALAYGLRPVLIPLFMAFIVAYILDPVVDFFERRKLRRGITIGVLALIVVLGLLSIPVVALPIITTQAYEFGRSAGQTVRGSEWINAVLDRVPWEMIAAQTGEPSPPEEKADAVPADEAVETAPADESETQTESAPEPETTDAQPSEAAPAPNDARARAIKAIQELTVRAVKGNAATLASAGRQAGMNLLSILASVGGGILHTFLFLANIALFAIVTVYLLLDFDPLIAGMGHLIPPRYLPKISEVARKIDEQLRSFLRGQLTVCFILAVMYTIGFMISGVPFAILIGLFALVASFIPFVGVASVALIALSVTLLRYGLDLHIVGVLVTVGIAQFLEGNVLTPKIVGDKVGLNPVWVILAVMVFGNFMGFLGLLTAVPIAAVLKVLVVEGVAYYKASPLFEGDDASG